MSKISDKMKTLRYRLFYCPDESEWVAKVTKGEYKGLNWMHKDANKALKSLMKLIVELDEKENK